jgi:phosphoribosylaminoimidazolecarboxamide formyltransferase/IMP cyclohydrolase
VDSWGRRLLDLLRHHGIGLVVLAGFLRRVPAGVVRPYRGRIVNVHPALLPRHGGRGMYGPRVHAAVLAAGDAESGATVHFVDERYDEGPVIARARVPVLAGDSPETLAARVLEQEHRLLPEVVARFARGEIHLTEDGVVTVTGRSTEGGGKARGTVEWADGGRGTTGTAGQREARAGREETADAVRIRRALLSVSDKTGLVDLARGLAAHGIELLSTGGTAAALRDAGLAVRDVSEETGFPEMLEGRVKTLHPRLFAGILARGGREDDAEAIAAHGIRPIELVAVNLYPFEAAAARAARLPDDALEQIDIGGPSLLRAAAKNFASVAVLCDPATYAAFLEELGRGGGAVGGAVRRDLAGRAFAHTAAYDVQVARPRPRAFPRRSRPEGGACWSCATARTPTSGRPSTRSRRAGPASPRRRSCRGRRSRTRTSSTWTPPGRWPTRSVGRCRRSSSPPPAPRRSRRAPRPRPGSGRGPRARS